MSEENTPEDSSEEAGIKTLPRMEDDEIREFVDALLSGNLFTSEQVQNESDIPMVFMPLMLGASEHLEPIIDDIGCLYEYMSKAGPRGINGQPVFYSFNVLHKDDWSIVLDTLKYEETRRQTMPVIRRNNDEEEST
jgi:hypothetical protein